MGGSTTQDLKMSLQWGCVTSDLLNELIAAHTRVSSVKARFPWAAHETHCRRIPGIGFPVHYLIVSPGGGWWGIAFGDAVTGGAPLGGSFAGDAVTTRDQIGCSRTELVTVAG